MVVGDGKKFVSAIVVPAEEPLQNYCKHKGIAWRTFEEMIQTPEIIAKISTDY